MVITKIEILNTQTVFSIEVTNKRDQGGWFCADKNIYLKDSKGYERYSILKAEGIPTCPEQYEFKNKGDILKFKLFFPRISEEIVFIDLIEDCNNACFYFNGIILNNQHNNNIVSFEKGFDLYQTKRYEESVSFFQSVISNETVIQSQIYSLSYYYLINIYFNKKEIDKVNLYYKKLQSSNFEDKETIIKELIRNNVIQEKAVK